MLNKASSVRAGDIACDVRRYHISSMSTTTDLTDLAARVAALEARVQLLELAVCQSVEKSSEQAASFHVFAAAVAQVNSAIETVAAQVALASGATSH